MGSSVLIREGERQSLQISREIDKLDEDVLHEQKN